MRGKIILSFLVAALALASCSTTKFVPTDAYLLDRVEVKSDVKAVDLGRMKQCVEQNGNSRWFSIMKVPLSTYSLAGRDSAKWLNRTLKAMGEAPVLYDTASTRRSCENIAQELRNQGYLHATVEASATFKGRKANVTYSLHPGLPYHISHVHYDIADPQIRQLLNLGDNTGVIRRGRQFNVADLREERNRITALLNDRGYYRFNKDYITFEADTISGEQAIDLTLVLRRYAQGDSLTDHPRYRIGRVVYRGDGQTDSLAFLSRKTLAANTFVEPGDFYSNAKLKRTYSHFGRLQAVRYTNISYREAADRLLDCYIQASPAKTHSLSFQPEGTNTAGDLGAAVSLTYQNRNLFHGSEVLSIEGRIAYEAIKGLEGYDGSNFEEYSIQGTLNFPRFIAPFLAKSFRRRINATSEMSVAYDLQNRPEYHRRVFSLAWRYKWNDANHHDRYQFDLIDLNYLSMPWISDTFRRNYLEDDMSRNAILRYNYDDLFIMRWGLRYTYNNNRWAIKANIETAGNLLDLISHVTRPAHDVEGYRTLFLIAYAQYAKFDFDFTRNLQLDYANTLVVHAGFGVAYPYGNSTILPFEKRYFSGGANSVRGWSVRSLGPGRYKGQDGRIDFINQTGDLKLDLNAELRTHLFWKFDGAVFVDAGNIWTLRAYEEQPGGQFKLKNLLRELAVAYGLGLRLNFSYFIVRFDAGMKAINPAYDTKEEHYAIVHPDFSRDFTFHFAVGLPF